MAQTLFTARFPAHYRIPSLPSRCILACTVLPLYSMSTAADVLPAPAAPPAALGGAPASAVQCCSCRLGRHVASLLSRFMGLVARSACADGREPIPLTTLAPAGAAELLDQEGRALRWKCVERSETCGFTGHRRAAPRRAASDAATAHVWADLKQCSISFGHALHYLNGIGYPDCLAVPAAAFTVIASRPRCTGVWSHEEGAVSGSVLEKEPTLSTLSHRGSHESSRAPTLPWEWHASCCIVRRQRWRRQRRRHAPHALASGQQSFRIIAAHLCIAVSVQSPQTLHERARLQTATARAFCCTAAPQTAPQCTSCGLQCTAPPWTHGRSLPQSALVAAAAAVSRRKAPLPCLG